MALIELGSGDILDNLIARNPLVLVDFWAPWCAPCRAMLPSIVTLSKHAKLTVVKVNADEFPQELAKRQVRGLPCLLLYQQGRLVERTADTLTLRQLQTWLAPYLERAEDTLFETAQTLSGQQQLDDLRQVLAINPQHLTAEKQLLELLFEQRQNRALRDELQQRLEGLTAERLRDPALSRIHSVLKFAQGISEQPAVLHSAYSLAIDGHYVQALDQLMQQLWQAKEQGDKELTSQVRQLIIQILNLMPERQLAHRYRRQLLALNE